MSNNLFLKAQEQYLKNPPQAMTQEEVDLSKNFSIAVVGLYKGCSCRPGGGMCVCCKTLERLNISRAAIVILDKLGDLKPDA